MCTVSMIPLSDGFRLVSNRDESRCRPAATPPRLVHRPGGPGAAYPVDPVGGGTWVAVNAAGVAMSLLNLNAGGAAAAAAAAGAVSRGTVIPALLDAAAADEAAALLGRLDLAVLAPFRLLIVDPVMSVVVGHAPGSPPSVRFARTPAAPLMLASSGLGDAVVGPPRAALFDELVLRGWPADDAGRVRRQDRFHAHRWPDAPHLSVRMARADARTVSRTEVEVRGGRVTARYVAVGDADRPADLASPVLVVQEATCPC